jgi:hypothetical protein
MKTPSAILILSFYALSPISCGSASGHVDTLHTCIDEGEALSEKAPACDPTEYGILKKKIADWEKSCGQFASPESRERLARTLSDSKKCVDATAAAIANKKECESKIAAITAESKCDIPKCNALIEALDNAMAFCKPSAAHGFDERGAEQLKESLKSRIVQLERESSVKSSMDQCSNSEALAAAGRTDEALAELTLALTTLLAAPAKQEPDAETSEKEARNKCADALQSFVDTFLTKMTDILANKKEEKNPLSWMSSYRNLAGTKSRLEEVHAERLVPDITAGLRKLLTSVDKKKNRIESESIAHGDALYKKTLEKGPKKCRRIHASISRVEGKIEEYQAKKNKKKVQAYTKKLEKIKAQLDTFMIQLKESVAKRPFDKEKMTQLLQKIDAAGCPASTGTPTHSNSL